MSHKNSIAMVSFHTSKRVNAKQQAFAPSWLSSGTIAAKDDPSGMSYMKLEPADEVTCGEAHCLEKSPSAPVGVEEEILVETQIEDLTGYQVADPLETLLPSVTTETRDDMSRIGLEGDKEHDEMISLKEAHVAEFFSIEAGATSYPKFGSAAVAALDDMDWPSDENSCNESDHRLQRVHPWHHHSTASSKAYGGGYESDREENDAREATFNETWSSDGSEYVKGTLVYI